MQDRLVSYPLTGLTPMEMRELTEKSKLTPAVDPVIGEMLDAPFGAWSIQARDNITGTVGWLLGESVADTLMDDYSDAVNLTKGKGDFNPLQDPMTWGGDNNPEGIARLLEGVQQDELPYILTANSWGEFNDRLRFVKAASPEAQEAAGFGLGTLVGEVSDFAGFVAVGAAAEPIMLAGLGTRGALAGRAAASAAGRTRHADLAAASLDAAKTVSRLNLAARGTAYGAAEAAMWQATRNFIDPAYDPDASAIMWDMAFSAGGMGLVGGALLGRRMMAEHIQDAANGFYAARMTDLPGGYKIKYTPGFAFESPAAADQMLFARGTGTLADEANRVGAELWEDWNKPGRKADFAAPGTRTQPLPVLEPEAPLREFDERTWEGARFGEGRTDIPTPRPGELPPISTTTKEFKEFFSGSVVAKESGAPLKVFRGVSPNFRGFGEADGPIYFSASREHAQRAGSIKGNEGGPIEAYLSIKNPFRTTDPDGVSFLTKAGIDELKAQGYDGAIGRMAYSDITEYVVFSPDQIRYARKTPALRLPPLQSVRSVIKTAAFELSLAGLDLSPQVFSTVARVLVNTEAKKLLAGAFNKEFWEGIAKEFPNVALREPAERAFIGNIDTTVRDIVQREDMVDAVYDYFRWNKDLAPDAPRSLIFQVLREISERGGKVNRQTVAEVVDELRDISQRPPKRTNARGAQRIDYNARRAAVVEVINRRAKSDKAIFMPPSLVRNMTPTAASASQMAMRLGRWTGAVGTDPKFNDVPRIQHWHDRLPGWNRIGNRSAFIHESENGALRLMGFLGMNASRSMDIAQPLTFKEKALQLLHSTLFSFIKSYRNGFVKFAVGEGTENVTRRLTLADSIKANFRSREARRAFHKRVAAQFESGRMDDPVEAVNETAKSIKDILKRTYDMASEAGLKGFTGPGVENYFPWLWRFDRIRRLATTEAGKQDLIRLVRTGFEDGRIVVIDGVEQTFTGDLDEASKVFVERLISIANKSENAPMLAQDQELLDALRALEGPLKAQQGSRTPFGRSRININREAAIDGTADHLNIGSSRLALADLRNDDIPYVMKRYLTSVIGATSEKQFFDAVNEQLRARGIFGPTYRSRSGELLNQKVEVENLGQLKALINKLGPTMSEAEDAALESVVGALRLAPAGGEMRLGIGDKITNLATSYGYLTTGGQFGLSAVSETNRIVGTVGMGAVFRQIPVLNEMMTNWANLDQDAKNFVSMLEANFAPSTNRMLRIFKDELATPMDVEIGRGGRAAQVAERAGMQTQRMLDSLSNWYSDISGLAPITSFTQMLATAGIIQHLYDVGKAGVRRLDDATVRSLGLEPDQYEKVIQFVTKNAKVKDGFMGPRVIDLDNLDAVEFDDLKQFVQRFVDSRIQSVPTRGDFHDSMFSFWGRLLLQFKTFNLKGIDNFLLQNSSRVARGAGIRVTQEIVATGVLAGLIHYSRNYADWWSYKQAGDRRRAEEAEKNLTVAGALRGVVMGPSEFFLLTQAGDAISTNFIDPDPIFSPYRYSGLKWYGFPAESTLSRGLSTVRDLWGAGVGKPLGLPVERDITQGTVHRMRLLMPFQNMLGFKQLLNITEQQITEEYDLKRSQPRDRD